jgi:hypothetical protein
VVHDVHDESIRSLRVSSETAWSGAPLDQRRMLKGEGRGQDEPERGQLQ